ncbi:ABC transporter permease [Kaustia mangrovi]|uniref:ABC transporter permease n=1 Tax=Kaustia mangrovi TaxID=2593653 RepID=A0A7S8C7H4_9HYPH|nr:ABC transporter permease [Kaustia mangrovi]QPC44828.1 ABC transporter permease [Kaustia mangrovi]
MDGIDQAVTILAGAIRAGTPLVFAALGELVAERSGVLNLGVEGMMLMGAVTGFIATAVTGDPLVGIAAAMLAGLAMALVFAALTLGLLANQVATGLALTIFGVGLSAFVGQDYVGTPIEGLKALDLFGLAGLPVVGPLLFGHDLMVYLSLVLLAAVAWVLTRTRAGLVLRAVGENPDGAHAIGHPVLRIRLLAVLFGGACAGVAGAYLSLVYTPQWAENMTAGRGWIALALVVFATWRPVRVALGAYLFGGITILGLHVQALGFDVSSQLMATLPYIATVVVLALISRDATRIRLNAPAALGRPFHPAA